MNPNEWVGLVLGSGLLFGIILRIAPVIMAGFPIYDGGMFQRMIEDLTTSQYVLPLTTSYNLLDIPYAYPPFGFYLARLLSDVFQIRELSLVRWLPAIFNILGLFAFYLLAQEILKSSIQAALSTTFLAVTPGGYLWHIMGGGLTRSLGSLFLLLSAYAVLSLFERGGWKRISLAVLTCSLAVLSHPEMGLHTLGTCVLLWLFYGRTRRGTLYAFFVALGTSLVTSIWWLTVILRFGVDPFLSALYTGLYGTPIFISLKNMVLSRISLVPVLPILRLAGIVWCLAKRKFFLVAWVVLPILVEPRSSAAVSLYPLSMLTAIGFTEALLFLVNYVRQRKAYLLLSNVTQSRVLNLAIMSVILYLFLEGYAVNASLVKNSLKNPALDAMAWVRSNTPVGSEFLVLTGNPSAMTDPLLEWFPALTDRRSQTTLQGLEWTLGPSFAASIERLGALQSCETKICIEDWSIKNNVLFSHLFLQKNTTSPDLQKSLQDGRYIVIYENWDIVVLSASKK